MTIVEALKWATKFLQENNIENAYIDAEILLANILQVNRTSLQIHPEKILKRKEIKLLKKQLQKRAKNIPVAYITGHKGFYRLDFLVSKKVLIPRPETEKLVEEVLKVLNNAHKKLVIADIGTGSGCISISLIKNSLNIFHVYSIDYSRAALRMAKKNAKHNGIKQHISFLYGNLAKPLLNIPVDILIANLPYLSYTEHKNCQAELKYEPRLALTDCKTGVSLYKKLFQQLYKMPSLPEYIFLEIGSGQAKAIKNLANKILPKHSIEIIKDLAGLDRIVKIVIKES